MTVAELMTKLNTLDPKVEIVCYTEDPSLLGGRSGFLLLDITDVSMTDAERTRVDGRPYLKLGTSTASSRMAMLDVTTDF